MRAPLPPVVPLAAAVVALSFAAATFAGSAPTATPHWPQFRGPGATSVADAPPLPLTWSATENVAWSVDVPGRGWSSPIVVGNRVVVTTAVNRGNFKAPSTGIYGNDYLAELKKQGLSEAEAGKRVIARDIELASEVEDVSYRVLTFDATTGGLLWEREAHRGKPPGGRHRKNTYASETPATDGERLYVSFGASVGVFCFSLDGEPLWQRTWPPQSIYLDFGTAASPVVHRGRVYVLRDSEGESFLSALDARTGDIVWTASRTDLPARMKSGWATPFIWETPARTEIVAIGKGLVISYDLDGRELWRLKGMTQATPSPTAGAGLLFVGSGSQGENNRPLYAIKPGATGDISPAEGETTGPFIAWFQPRGTPYTGSPLFYRDRLFSVNDNGVMQVFAAATGEEIYRARVGGPGNTFSSTPLANDGRIYALNENGTTLVFAADGTDYRELAKNPLGEISLASPAAAHGTLFIRTQTKLHRIATPARKG